MFLWHSFIWRFSSCAFQCVSGLCLLSDGSGQLHDFSSTYWLRSLLFPLIFCFTRQSLECAIKLIQHLFYLYSWVYFWLSAHGKNSVKAKMAWSCVKPWVLRPQAAADCGTSEVQGRKWLSPSTALPCCCTRVLSLQIFDSFAPSQRYVRRVHILLAFVLSALIWKSFSLRDQHRPVYIYFKIDFPVQFLMFSFACFTGI